MEPTLPTTASAADTTAPPVSISPPADQDPAFEMMMGSLQHSSGVKETGDDASHPEPPDSGGTSASVPGATSTPVDATLLAYLTAMYGQPPPQTPSPVAETPGGTGSPDFKNNIPQMVPSDVAGSQTSKKSGGATPGDPEPPDSGGTSASVPGAALTPVDATLLAAVYGQRPQAQQPVAEIPGATGTPDFKTSIPQMVPTEQPGQPTPGKLSVGTNVSASAAAKAPAPKPNDPVQMDVTPLPAPPPTPPVDSTASLKQLAFQFHDAVKPGPALRLVQPSSLNLGQPDTRSLVNTVVGLPGELPGAVGSHTPVVQSSEAPVTLATLPDQLPHVVMRALAQNGLSPSQGATVQIRLDPPSLGAVWVRMTQNKGVMEAQVTVSHMAVEKALNQELPRLSGQLSQHGIQLGQVSVQTGQQGTTDGGWHQAWNVDDNLAQGRPRARSPAATGPGPPPIGPPDAATGSGLNVRA